MSLDTSHLIIFCVLESIVLGHVILYFIMEGAEKFLTPQGKNEFYETKLYQYYENTLGSRRNGNNEDVGQFIGGCVLITLIAGVLSTILRGVLGALGYMTPSGRIILLAIVVGLLAGYFVSLYIGKWIATVYNPRRA